MSDKIRKEDIFEAGAINQFDDAKKRVQELNEAINVLTKSFDSLKAAKAIAENIKFEGAKDIKDFNKAVADAVKAEDDMIKSSRKVKEATEAEIKAKIQQQQATANQKKELKDLIVLEDKEAGTLQKLKALNSQLTSERNKLNLETATGKKRLQEINAELDRNNKFINDNSDSLTKQKNNVGNYANSIKTALRESGLFGESTEKLTLISERAVFIYELLEKGLEKLTGLFTTSKEVQEANTLATEANTAATEAQIAAEKLNSAATEANTVVMEGATTAEEANVVALESQIAATEEATVVTGKFGKALNFIKDNPLLLVIAGIAAVSAALIGAKRATQEGEDASKRFTEGLEAEAEKAGDLAAKTLGSADAIHSYNIEQVDAAKQAKELLKAEQELRDERDANILTFSKLHEEATQAKLDAEEENKTTQEKIELLQKVIDTTNKLSDKQQDEAKKELLVALKLTDNAKNRAIAEDVLLEKIKITRQFLSENLGRIVKEDDVKKAQEAAAKVFDIEAERNASLVRTQRRLTSTIEADRKERAKLLQEARKEEIESIRITSQETISIAEQERDKNKKLENERFRTEEENLKEQQRKLGLLKDPAEAEKQQAAFNREVEAAHRLHNSNLLNIDQKFADEQKKLVDKLDKDIRAITIKNEAEAEAEAKKMIEENEKALKEHNKRIIYETTEGTRQQLNAQIEAIFSEAEFKIANEKHTRDEIFNIRSEAEEKIAALEKKFNDKAAEEERKKIEQKIKYAEEFLKSIEEGLQQRFKKEETAADREIDLRKRQVDRQLALAQNGQKNQLAFEDKKLAEAELRKKKLLEQQRKQEEALKLAEVFLNSLNQKIAAKEPYSQAAAEALSETFIAKGVTALIAGSFAEGVENFRGKGSGTSDSNLIAFSNGESVVTADATSRNPGVVSDLNDGTFKDKYLPAYAMGGGMIQDISKAEQVNSAIIQVLAHELKSVKKAIENKKEFSVNWENVDGRFDRIEKVIENQKSVITRFVGKKPRI